MSSRQARELPKIDIGGTQFYLDLRLQEFRDSKNFANRIDLDDLFELSDGTYKLWFDQKNKNLFAGSPDAFAGSKHVVEVTLPAQQDMDPLGFVWLMEDQGWLSEEEAKIKTTQLLPEYVIHKNGMILQRKQQTNDLLVKRAPTNKNRRNKKL